MNDFRDLSELHMDGRLVQFLHRNGATSICPAVPMVEPSKAKKREMAQAGHWPDAGFTATGWREVTQEIMDADMRRSLERHGLA